jgi:LAS superfamily LD-carboxypeptidase LdcB
VRAHIQLLKKYAAGSTPLAHPDVAPDAGASATIWVQLTGTWASDQQYWNHVSALYQAMLKSADDDHRSTTAATQDRHCEPHAAPHQGDQALALASVRGITVHTSIATHLDALLVAAEADGLILTGTGYRSHQRQIELRRAHCGLSDYAVYEAPASTCAPPTARPGTSMHERGVAIDFDNCSTQTTPCWRWLNNNAAHHGLYNLPSEPWHWSTNAQ